MNLWKKILEWSGWKFSVDVELPDKCVICVAPHTSNWDFILGLCAYRSIGRKANFLMKSSWFFFPLGALFRSLGGIPVVRKGGKGSLTANVVERFNKSEYINLAVTPEGTRSATDHWHTGFLYIAVGAKVPVLLAVIDYKKKEILISEKYNPTGDVDTDMAAIKSYYSKYTNAARYPEKFQI